MEYRALFLQAVESVALPQQEIDVNDLIFKFNRLYIVREVNKEDNKVLLQDLYTNQRDCFLYLYTKFPIVLSNKLKKEIRQYRRPTLVSKINRSYLKNIRCRNKGN